MSAVRQYLDGLLEQWRLLQAQWGATRDLWHDPVRHYFEREFWQQYEEVMPPLLKDMDRLDRVIAEAMVEVH